MKVLYYNSCWFTNVGEAFIDIGAMELIRRVLNNPTIINISNMNIWYANDICKREKIKNPYWENKKIFKMFENYEGEYLIAAGMYACEQFLRMRSSQYLLDLAKRGVKIIFLGLGQELYTNSEKEKFKSFIEKISPSCIMTRDDYVYENFSGLCPIIKGIDCAFWVKDCYDPRNAMIKSYDVVTYNRSEEPRDLQNRDDVVRAYHMQWNFSSKNFVENLFISDVPYDYLTLYGNANKIYTDLVHATIIGLQYGVPVKFERVDNRGYAIDALNQLKHDTDGFLVIEENALEFQKSKIEIELRDILS